MTSFSPGFSACPSHRLDDSSSQFVEAEIDRPAPEANQIGPVGQLGGNLGRDGTQSTTPAVPNDGPTNVPTNRVRDEHLVAIIARREKVYRHRTATSLPPTCGERGEHGPAVHPPRVSGQAERRTRPRRRRAFNTARPARVDMR